ncbi:uncharacterized protein LOC119734919 [Patiria miniata]|uniref:Farnesoic acid O-methyl transferase domain-containing protein n=1 Tax=Patiria miniata TaxID=46514 RepID=A0A914ALM6_PATMI|nr:uncharacterized protein LOC119734919 [Patiria miniata]
MLVHIFLSTYTYCIFFCSPLYDYTACAFTLEKTWPPVATFILEPLRAPFRLDFDVKANRDAMIVLAEEKTNASVFAWITMNAWERQRSAIRACFLYDLQECVQLLGGRSEHTEVDIIVDSESRPFWMEYKHGVVTVGKGGQEEAFLEWDAAAYHRRNISTPVYLGISAWSYGGVSIEWVFYQFCG